MKHLVLRVILEFCTSKKLIQSYVFQGINSATVCGDKKKVRRPMSIKRQKNTQFQQ